MQKFILLLLAALLPISAQAALKFDYHSDSASQAYYASAWRALTKLESAATAVTLTAGPTGTFGGTYLDMSSVTNNDNFITFVGADNAPLASTGASFLFRLVPVASGAPVASAGIFSTSSVKDSNQGALGGFAFNINTLGKLCVTAGASNGSGLTYFNTSCCASALTLTANTPTDVWFTWDGTSTAGHASVWQAQNGNTASQLCTLTASNAQSTVSRAAAGSLITEDLANLLQNKNQFHINEIAIWDDQETPSTYGARATWVNTGGGFEGYNYTAEGAGNVRNGTVYGPGPGSLTGTLVVPSLANTKTGVAGDGGTGTYDGSDRWSDPGVGLVIASTAYKANSTTNNRTGTYAAPATSVVQIGQTFGTSSTGTYDGSDRWTCPTAGNLLSTAAALKCNSVTTNLSGTYVTVPVTKVENTYAYGVAGGSVGTDLCTDPSVANVGLGVGYYVYSTHYVGTYVPAGTIDPGQANVRSGTGYALDGIVKVGTMQLPPVGKVQSGYLYDDGTVAGTLACTALSAGVVAAGTSYTNFTGTYTGTLSYITNVLSQAITVANGPLGRQLPLNITQGDVATLQLLAQVGLGGNAYDLTGAVFTSYIKNSDGTTASFQSSQHTIVSATGGTFTLALTGVQTAALKAGGPREVVTKVVQGALVTYFHGALVNVLAASPGR